MEDAQRTVALLETESRRTRPLEIDANTVRESVARLRETLRTGTIQERKKVLGGVLEAVTVDSQGVEIEYRLPRSTEGTESISRPVLSALRSTGAWGIRTRLRLRLTAKLRTKVLGTVVTSGVPGRGPFAGDE